MILIPTLTVMFLFVASEGMVVPILAPTLAKPISQAHDLMPGFSAVAHKIAYGIFMGLYPVLLFIFAPILGSFSDSIGRKKVLMFCIFVGIFATLAQGLGVLFSSLTLLFLGRIAISAASGVDGTAQATILDRCSQKYKSRYIGYTLTVYSIGFLAGPAIAGVFISEDSVGNMSFAEPFYIMTAGFLISAVWLMFALPNDSSKNPKKIKFFEGIRDMVLVLKDKKFRTLTGIFVIGNLGGGCYAMTIPIYLLESFNFSAKLLAWYMAFGSLISAFSYIVITPFLVRKFDKIKLSNFCYLLVALAALIAYFAIANWHLWLCNILFMLSFCTAYSACLDAYSEMVGENRRAWILSVVLSIWGLASGGGLVLSSIGISIHTRLTLLFSALLLISGFLLPFFANSAKKKF